MGLFKDWAKANIQQTTLTGANTPDRLYAIWESYAGANFATFAAYARSRASGTASTADLDPAARLAAAKLNADALAGARALFTELDNFSDHVGRQAHAQQQREAAELHANRTALQTATTPTAQTGQLPTVRLQLQSNFKQKGGSDIIATESVTSTGGVTVRQLDAAFERILTASSWGKKLASQARAAYDIHKGKWGVYTQGNSYSVYFDEQSIVTSGRPKGGYRLDVENIRAGNTPNFV